MDSPQASLQSIGVRNGDVLYLLAHSPSIQPFAQANSINVPTLPSANNTFSFSPSHAALFSPSARPLPVTGQPDLNPVSQSKSTSQAATPPTPFPPSDDEVVQVAIHKLRLIRDCEIHRSALQIVNQWHRSLGHSPRDLDVLHKCYDTLGPPYVLLYMLIMDAFKKIGLSCCELTSSSDVDDSAASLSSALTALAHVASPSSTLSLTLRFATPLEPVGKHLQLRMFKLGDFVQVIAYLDANTYVRLELSLAGTFSSRPLESTLSSDCRLQCATCALSQDEGADVAFEPAASNDSLLAVGRSSGMLWFALGGQGRLHALHVAILDRLILPTRAIVARGMRIRSL